MNTPLRVSKGYGSQVKYAVLMPLFYFVFCFVYNPFSMSAIYNVGGKSWTFHLLMLTCIMVGTLALTRLVFSFLYKYIPFKWWHYAVWCLGETLVTSFFFALYTSLFYRKSGGMPYFTALPYCFKTVSLTLIYPYLLCILLRIVSNKNADLAEAGQKPEESLIKFYDEHKAYQLRNSMKSLEGDAQRHGFVRCHRSYYVNPRHIKVLSRDREGVIYTEFTREGVGHIPVSKQYYDSLAKLL